MLILRLSTPKTVPFYKQYYQIKLKGDIQLQLTKKKWDIETKFHLLCTTTKVNLSLFLLAFPTMYLQSKTTNIKTTRDESKRSDKAIYAP